MTKVKVHFILAFFAFCLAGSAQAQDDMLPGDAAEIRSINAILTGTFRCPIAIRTSPGATGVMVTVLLPPFTTVSAPQTAVCARVPATGVTNYLVCTPRILSDGTANISVQGNFRPPAEYTEGVSCAALVTSTTPDTVPQNNFKSQPQ
jgi:hypothetical protein